MLHKCLSRFETALEPSNSDGPMSHVDIGEHQRRDGRTILAWNCWDSAGAFAHSETVIESQRQNAPGTLIGFARQFKQFFDLIHFEVSSAVYLNYVLPLVAHHKRYYLYLDTDDNSTHVPLLYAQHQ